MANILVYAEQRQNHIKSYALEAISEGRRLADASGGTLTVSLLGSALDDLATTVGNHGADKILAVEGQELDTYQPQVYAAQIKRAIEDSQAEIILFSSSAMGKELAPLVAAGLDASLVSDVTGSEWMGDHLELLRPVYAGKAFLRLAVRKTPSVVTLRPNVFSAVESGGTAEIIKSSPVAVETSAVMTITGTVMKETTRPELTEASIIVSGGRGMGGAENYPVIEALADTLGAGVGASRAAVDAGWRPHSDQVGQTGKTVSPNLYIACGISGAIQHLAGMSSSKTIVAINTDPEAPIFKVADYGIIGDLFEVVPALDQAVKDLLA